MKNAPNPYADTTTGPIGTPAGGYSDDPDRHPASTIREEPVSGPRLRGPDVAYLKTVSGIAKICQIVFSLVGFIVALATVWFPGRSFVSFATINGFVGAVIWFVLHLLHAIPQILANYYIELIEFMITDVFLFVAAIVCSVCGFFNAAIGFLAFVCFAATVAFAVDIVLQVVDIRQKFTVRRYAAANEQPRTGSI